MAATQPQLTSLEIINNNELYKDELIKYNNIINHPKYEDDYFKGPRERMTKTLNMTQKDDVFNATKKAFLNKVFDTFIKRLDIKDEQDEKMNLKKIVKKPDFLALGRLLTDLSAYYRWHHPELTKPDAMLLAVANIKSIQ